MPLLANSLWTFPVTRFWDQLCPLSPHRLEELLLGPVCVNLGAYRVRPPLPWGNLIRGGHGDQQQEHAGTTKRSFEGTRGHKLLQKGHLLSGRRTEMANLLGVPRAPALPLYIRSA